MQIPASVTYIGKSAFYKGAKNVYYEGTEEQWDVLVSQDSTGILVNCAVAMQVYHFFVSSYWVFSFQCASKEFYSILLTVFSNRCILLL